MWIWQRPDWPNFDYDENLLSPLLKAFDENNQISLRDTIVSQSVNSQEFMVTIHGLEAFKTSEIENENHQTLKSLKHSFNVLMSIMSKDGLPSGTEKQSERRKGVSSMMSELYADFAEALTHETLHGWQAMLIHDQNERRYAGRYRTDSEPITVIEANNRDKADFEAPSHDIQGEMEKFIKWYNDTGSDGEQDMHPVIRAGLAHLHFVTIHPYNDGNGRIARALCVKAISEYNNEPTLISLSHAISESLPEYYDALHKATKDHDVNAWLSYFAKTVVKAQELTKEKLLNAAIFKTIEENYDLNVHQRQLMMHFIEGKYIQNKARKKISDNQVSVDDYTILLQSCGDREVFNSFRERAKSENIGFKQMAENDLNDMVRKGILKCDTSSGKVKFALAIPDTNEIKRLIKNLTKPYEVAPKKVKRQTRDIAA